MLSMERITEAFKEVERAKRLRPSHYGTRKLRLQLLMALGDFKVRPAERSHPSASFPPTPENLVKLADDCSAAMQTSSAVWLIDAGRLAHALMAASAPSEALVT